MRQPAPSRPDGRAGQSGLRHSGAIDAVSPGRQAQTVAEVGVAELPFEVEHWAA